jgi:uncharacterized lipoprotein YddW (UPF0748 family)
MRKILCVLSVLMLLSAVSCEKAKDYPWNPAWDKYQHEAATPEEPDVPSGPVLPADGKERLVWIDAAANFKDYANDEAKITADMAKIKSTGFTGVIVDVRPTNTGLLFKSDLEAPLTRVDAWAPNYTWVERTATFDYLQAFIDAGKKEGLDVYAAINTMVGGCDCGSLGKEGFLYNDPAKKSWASQVNTESGIISCLEHSKTGAKFINPANDEAVNYVIGILEDLAAYDITGIILDRCRYDDHSLISDFSDVSREKFETFIGQEVENWPNDVFAPGATTLSTPVTAMQKNWLSFRAKMIHDFMEKASEKVHAVKPSIKFGAYVGAWYSSYYESGVNWASPKYNTASKYNWAGDDYKDYGYADHCDIMIIGAYASTLSITGSSEWTMQGFCQLAQTLFAGDVPFIGGPDVGNSTGFNDNWEGKTHKNYPDVYPDPASIMPDIVDACYNASTGGVFFFDLCHIKKYDYFDDIKKGFDALEE